MGVTDDEFKMFATQVEQEELARSQKKSTGGFEYEQVKWTGLPERGYKIIRALGAAPNSNASPTTSRTVRFAVIKADDGKDIRVSLPTGPEKDDHILWRIINNIEEVAWVPGEDKKNIKVYTNKLRHPDIFNMVTKNSHPEGSDRNKFDRGWAGRDMFIMNCIDRNPTMYAWSRANKHTVLLSKHINIGKNAEGKPVEYPETGIPAFGFTNILALNIFKHYGDWNNFDLAIERTGIMQSPNRIIHASKYKEEIPTALHPEIVDGPLTEEELSWEQYDLSKLFKVVSYTKLYNRLNKSIAKIDLSLGTHYVDELKSLAEIEKKQREDAKAEEEDSEESEANAVAKDLGSAPASVAIETPKASRTVASNTTSEVPKGYEFLNETEKSLIISMKRVDDKKWDITYNTTEELASCNVCKTPSPSSFAICPGCGSTF